jgi:hypothetical protein
VRCSSSSSKQRRWRRRRYSQRHSQKKWKREKQFSPLSLWLLSFDLWEIYGPIAKWECVRACWAAVAAATEAQHKHTQKTKLLLWFVMGGQPPYTKFSLSFTPASLCLRVDFFDFGGREKKVLFSPLIPAQAEMLNSQ